MKKSNLGENRSRILFWRAVRRSQPAANSRSLWAALAVALEPQTMNLIARFPKPAWREARRGFLLASLAAIALAPPLGAQQSVAYTSAVTQSAANLHFVVTVTSNSGVALACSIQYTGKSFQNTTRQGTRELMVPAPGKQSAQVVRSLQFAGFRTFTATVACKAR